jgi:salicylate hydroxylase
MGDAAHATTPWQGSGAMLGFEDAMILGALLAKIRSVDDIELAFRVYSDVRRPRAQAVIDSSRGTGLISTGQNAEVGLDPKKLDAALESRWNFIYDLDLDEYKEEALDRMDKLQVI